MPSLPIRSSVCQCSIVLGRFGYVRLNAGYVRLNAGVDGIAGADRRDRDRNVWDLMLWTQLGRGSRIQACVMSAGGAGVSDLGLVNGCRIG